MKIRKGFTLVELLVVIVVIGILAAAMLLSGGSAAATAEAAKIINNLRDLKGACLMLNIDSRDHFETAGLNPAVNVSMLARYIDDPKKLALNEDGTSNVYKFEIVGGAWWVGYNLSITNRTDVAEKLIGKAVSLGLYDESKANIFNDKTDDLVWMFVWR